METDTGQSPEQQQAPLNCSSAISLAPYSLKKKKKRNRVWGNNLAARVLAKRVLGENGMLCIYHMHSDVTEARIRQEMPFYMSSS